MVITVGGEKPSKMVGDYSPREASCDGYLASRSISPHVVSLHARASPRRSPLLPPILHYDPRARGFSSSPGFVLVSAARCIMQLPHYSIVNDHSSGEFPLGPPEERKGDQGETIRVAPDFLYVLFFMLCSSYSVLRAVFFVLYLYSSCRPHALALPAALRLFRPPEAFFLFFPSLLPYISSLYPYFGFYFIETSYRDVCSLICVREILLLFYSVKERIGEERTFSLSFTYT